MKSTFVEKSTERYPCIMRRKDTNTLVLFTKRGAGVVIAVSVPSPEAELGWYTEMWLMEHFEPFHGSVTLHSED